MFFQISKFKQDNFPHNHQTANFVISLDEGWAHTKDLKNNDIWYKGYLDSGQLSVSVLDIAEEQEPTHHGNFCVIKVFDQGLVIRTDRLRSFPLWYNPDIGLTNLKNIGETLWTDCVVMLHNNLTISRSNFDVIGNIDTSTLSFDQVVYQIDQILTTKTQNFLSNLNNPIRVFLSGGIDTGLLYSYIEKNTSNFDMISYMHCDRDYFYLKNHNDLEKLWGYTQIHHWKEPCVLASGAPGDEFTVRSPITANLMLLHYGMSIVDLMNQDQYKTCLHYSYYSNEKYLTAWRKQQAEYQQMTLEDTIRVCCNYNVNDWQHWHFGNTLTWTPLRDLDIFKLIARLGPDDLKEQVMNSTVQLELIRRNNPKILDYLSIQKNENNYMSNLTNLL
jgi:hypothetical protein